MKLPRVEDLSPEQYGLYRHDTLELHSQAKTCTSEAYKKRLYLMHSIVKNRMLQNACILDIGCAQANLALTLAEDHYRVIATDIRSHFIDYAKKKYEKGSIEFVETSFYDLNYKSEVDCIVLGEIIEHIAKPIDLLTICHAALKKNGLLLLSTPNGSRFLSDLPTFSQIVDTSIFIKEQFKPDGEGHLFLYTALELFNLLTVSGFNRIEVTYWGSPFLCGHFKFRHFNKFIAWEKIYKIDEFINKLSLLRKVLSAGLVVSAIKGEIKS